MLINWYPWLIKPYKDIIYQHQIGKAHHALLMNTCRGMGVLNLFWAITRWLLCKNKNGIKSCGQCHDCHLMTSNNHPDWHQVKIKNNANTLGIEEIRNTIDKIFYTAQQNGEKIIWLPDISYITYAGITALLKTLEEPPKNTWFFLINYNSCKISNTLRSRCFSYSLLPPSEEIGVRWLKKNQCYENTVLSLTALRITEGSPLLAKKIITGMLWSERKLFFLNLKKAVHKKDLFSLLPFLNKKKIHVIIYIDWICFLLFDSIKLKYNLLSFIKNLDQEKFIKYLSSNYNIPFLENSIQSWIICKYKLTNVMGVNYELLLVEQLLKWEKMLSYNKYRSKPI